MPWQQLVADVGTEMDPDTGLPAYREVICTIPRRSGKTTLILSFELQRALRWGTPQRSSYTARLRIPPLGVARRNCRVISSATGAH